MDMRERFEKALAQRLMALTRIPTVVVQRPDDDEEAVYKNGMLAEVIDLGGAMALEESFVHCVARDDWDCGEFIWTRAKGDSAVLDSEFKVLSEYVEKRHFLIGPTAGVQAQQ